MGAAHHAHTHVRNRRQAQARCERTLRLDRIHRSATELIHARHSERDNWWSDDFRGDVAGMREVSIAVETYTKTTTAPNPRRTSVRNAPQAMPRHETGDSRRKSGSHRIEQSGINYRPADFEHSVRIDAAGNVLAGHGRVRDMAALSAYVCRLGDLIGEFMDLGKLSAFEATHRSGNYLLFRDEVGHAVAVVPRPNVGLQRLRARFSL
jgi:hypothetical protein